LLLAAAHLRCRCFSLFADALPRDIITYVAASAMLSLDVDAALIFYA